MTKTRDDDTTQWGGFIPDWLGEFRIFWQIILPQASPGVAALTIFTFIGQWNDYISPLIYLSSREGRTYVMQSACDRPEPLPLTASAGDAYEAIFDN